MDTTLDLPPVEIVKIDRHGNSWAKTHERYNRNSHASEKAEHYGTNVDRLDILANETCRNFGRLARRVALIALLFFTLLASGCTRADFGVGDNATDDAAKGATIGGILAGPQGAVVGAGVMTIIGMIVRAIEKPIVKRRAIRQGVLATK